MLDFFHVRPIVIGDMKIRFNKQVTVDFLDHIDEVSNVYDHEKTFYHNQIVECERMEETVRGFVDLVFDNGDVAVGVPKEGLTIL